MPSEATCRVLDSLYRKGDRWSLFEIQVHARVLKEDPFKVQDEVKILLDAGQLSLVEEDARMRVVGWIPTALPSEEECDASQSECAAPHQ